MSAWKQTTEGGASRVSPAFGRELEVSDSHTRFLPGGGVLPDAKEDPRNPIRQNSLLGQDRKELAEIPAVVIGGILPSSFGTF